MAKTVTVNTADGILWLGNMVRGLYGPIRDQYIVRLPSGLDYVEKLYTLYLFQHPHPNVKITFTEEQLWKL